MKQKFITILLCSVVLISNLFAGSLLRVDADSSLMSKSTFMNMVKENEHFIEYQDKFLSSVDEPYVFNPTFNEENIQDGWILQYEFKYNDKSVDENNPIVANFSSILSFMYTEDMDTLETSIIDYSNILEEKVIVLENLNTSEIQTISIEEIGNEGIEELVADIEDKIEIDTAEIENSDLIESNSIHYGYICWQCSKYVSGGGYTDKDCLNAIGTGCRLANFNWAIKLICQGGKFIACYVPSYRYCVAGEWKTTCPTTT